MSRPFSYNDENFTVIGNVLFVHIIDNKARESFEPVVEIPPGIFERMETKTNFSIFTYSNFNDYVGTPVAPITTRDIENKHYFAFATDIPASNDERLCWTLYFLKDI